MGGTKSKSKQEVRAIQDPLQLSRERALSPQVEAARRSLGTFVDPSVGVDPRFLGGEFAESPFSELKFATPRTAAAFGSLLGLTSSAALESKFKDLFNINIAPEIESRLIASGLGRSGAIGEQIRRAGVEAALPLEFQRQANVQNLANFLSNLDSRQAQIAQFLVTPRPISNIGQTTTTSQSVTPLGFLGTVGSVAANAFLPGIGSFVGNRLFGGGATSATSPVGVGAPAFINPSGFNLGRA